MLGSNSFVTVSKPVPWEGEMPEPLSRGMLVFDRSGALLGGGVVQEVPEGDNSKKVIGNRWCVALSGVDWAPILAKGETEMNLCLVTPECVTLMQTTMMQLGQAWMENESTWAGRMEGAMMVLHSLGIEINDDARPKPNCKDTTHGCEKNNGKHDGFVDTSPA